MTSRPAGAPILWSGLAAALVYGGTVLVGGAILPAYDPWSDPISAMTAAGRTDSAWVGSCFVVYNLLLAAYGAGGLLLRGAVAGWRIVFALLLGTAAAGLLMGPFAMDAAGSGVTPAGMVHIGLAAFTSLATIAMVGLSIRLWRGDRDRALRRVAIACLGLIVPFGLLAALAVANGWPLGGLYERLTIGGFEVWLGAGAAAFARDPRRLAPPPHR